MVLQKNLKQEKHKNYKRYRHDEAITKEELCSKETLTLRSRLKHKLLVTQTYSQNQPLMLS
jgi:hypothetical protein